MPRLVLDRDELRRFMEAEGIQTRFELAQRMGVSPSTVTRLLDGDQGPGPAVIAGFKSAFPGRNTESLTTAR